MASPYPPFIFQDAVPAQQMMAHAQAVNEGMRIAELGKARQAEGLFRIAQLQQQQKAQQEKNELDRMIAESQIAQARIGNEFQNKKLAQDAALTREGYQRDRDIYSGSAGLNPSLRTEMAKQEYNDRLTREAKEDELRTVTEAERALEGLALREVELRKIQTSGAKDINTPVLQKNFGDILRQRTAILENMSRSGYSYDPVARRFIGVNRANLQQPRQPASDTPPSASSMFGPNLGGMIDLTPFQKATLGLQSGQAVVQDGVTYTVR